MLKEIKLCQRCSDDQQKKLVEAIMQFDATIENTIDACGDIIINNYIRYPEMRKYISQTIDCITNHTIDMNDKEIKNFIMEHDRINKKEKELRKK